MLEFLDKKIHVELASFRAISLKSSSEVPTKKFTSSWHSSSSLNYFDPTSFSSVESTCGEDSSESTLQIANLSLNLHPLSTSFKDALDSVNRDFYSCPYFNIVNYFPDSKLYSRFELKEYHAKPYSKPPLELITPYST